tara:strand:+ start:218 stop:346 length:129 start_codon:yes stop_codon:yes gene_type:complete
METLGAILLQRTAHQALRPTEVVLDREAQAQQALAAQLQGAM